MVAQSDNIPIPVLIGTPEPMIDDELARVFYVEILERIRQDRDFRQKFLEEFRDYQIPSFETSIGGTFA